MSGAVGGASWGRRGRRCRNCRARLHMEEKLQGVLVDTSLSLESHNLGTDKQQGILGPIYDHQWRASSALRVWRSSATAGELSDSSYPCSSTSRSTSSAMQRPSTTCSGSAPWRKMNVRDPR